MTPTDLRIKYKLETGHDAVFEGNHLTAKYAEWLEIPQSRDRYKKSTGNDAVYWHKRSESMVYHKEYRLWLEERQCETRSILEKLKNNK